MDDRILRIARDAIGFLYDEEGLTLYEAGLRAGKLGPLLEVGSYCGKSAVYLGEAARERETVLYSVDHHRGSLENQPGQEWHDPRLIDPRTGSLDTLPFFRRTIRAAGLDQVVVGIVGESATVGQRWGTPLGLVFIDADHDEEAVRADYEMWSHHIVSGGILAIHDVLEDPSEGGRGPFFVYEEALASGRFREIERSHSLRVLERS